MGVTTRGLPYPEPEDLVYLGANDFQELAEAIDAQLEDLASPPSITLQGSTDNPDADSRVVWADPSVRQRGVWSWTPSGGHLIVPPKPGLYFVSLTYKLDPIGSSGDDHYNYTVRLQRKVLGDDQADAHTEKSFQPPTVVGTDGPDLSLSGLVNINDTPDMGIQVQITCPDVAGNKPAPDETAQLQIVYLGKHV